MTAHLHEITGLAVPKIPQTDLFRYPAGPLTATLRDAGWAGYSYERILEDCPQRFRIADIYSDPKWNRGNIVQYVQNTGDTTHVRDHLTPFLLEVGAKHEHVFSALTGQFAISRPFTGGGHVPVPPSYWVAESDFAITRLRKMRARPVQEPLWKVPEDFNPPAHLKVIRDSNISQHRVENTQW